ncbi:hypothetical protein SAMN05444411_101209 [Lutibacter oricola]|uniref:Uncharacterized protein n=1 Tax=Lutibacter oricola TaxID=762486 RepID=A0A1H2REY0_9FLAO|nr:hypothetical protein [Lutibacter oricola]SDW17364.1 hypothetical protein SAMN05444411_101209 [Lutibacter oricola]
MKLTSHHIQELHKFTRAHYVEHFDVQTELVDHLANDIEAIWQEKPNLTFDEAKTISFKKFGVYGFMNIVEKRTNALYKKYWRLVWSIFKSYFKLPQVISVFILFILVYSSFSYNISNQKWIYIFLGFGIIIFMIYHLFRLHKIKRNRQKQSGKKWLFEESILNAGGIGAFSYLFFQIPLSFEFQLQSFYSIFLMSLFLTCYILIIYCVLTVLPSRIEIILSKTISRI